MNPFNLSKDGLDEIDRYLRTPQVRGGLESSNYLKNQSLCDIVKKERKYFEREKGGKEQASFGISVFSIFEDAVSTCRSNIPV